MEIITMPKLGLIMTEGTITEWYKNEGEHINEGEPLFQVETQKLSNDVESTVSGVINKILAQVGDTVECLKPVAEIQPD